jgi:hypothetical protein
MTEGLLVGLVAPHWRAAREKGKTPAIIGVQTDTHWQGPDAVSLDGEQVRVAECSSVLEAREILAASAKDGLVIITPLPLKELGADVEARLLRHRLFRVEPWDLLRARFNAKAFDASLLGKTALAEAAIEAAVTPEPAAAGVLTTDVVWRVVLEARLGLAEAKPDARAWLEWARRAENTARWRALPAELAALLPDWLTGYLSDWARPFVGTMDAGYGSQAMAIGLALGVIQKGTADARVALAQALGRLEQMTGGAALSPVAQKVWAQAAEQWASACCASGKVDEPAVEIAEADRLLEKIGAAPFAYFGSWSRTGFAQRLDALSRSVEAGDANMDASLEAISRHEIARCFGRERAWMDRAQMAVRLRRWLSTPETPVSNWMEAVGSYTAGGAWVDTARQALFTGDEPQDIARRWRSLGVAAEHRRDRENLVFAKNLAEVSAADLPLAPAVPIESVLERVLAPWGKEKALLIVMDGMSFAVWHELQSEVEGRNWRPQSWSEGQPLPPAVTVLPSATTFSRCSLLCGRLGPGGQEVEKKGFAENEALRAVARTGFPPVLFHKDEVGTGSHAISETLRRELRNDARKIVGVVINVIDDSLSGPEQRSFRWSLDQIPILRALLDEAELSGRTVVIASDHGHVLDRGTEMRKTDGGDRYRMDRYRPIESGPAQADEVVLTGRRVLESQGRMIAPATEGIRYSARKLGYHGGATAAECLAPLAVLVPPGRKLEGWQEAAEILPSWWFAGLGQEVQKPVRRRPDPAQPLFEGIGGIEKDWVADFLASETLTEQMAILGGRLEVSRVADAINALRSRNGVLMKTALAQKLGIPAFRIDGFLSNLQRVLNVDSYPVISVDASQTVRLDMELLKRQFGLE